MHCSLRICGETMRFDDRLVKQYMKTDVAYVTSDARLADVVIKMGELQTGIVIVKSGDYIIGVVTSSDIYSALVKEVFSRSVKGVIVPVEELDDLKVLDMMRGPKTPQFMTSCQLDGTNPCVQIGENDTIEDAIKVMGVSNIHHLLVIGKDGQIVGTLSSNDILKVFGKGVNRMKKEFSGGASLHNRLRR